MVHLGWSYIFHFSVAQDSASQFRRVLAKFTHHNHRFHIGFPHFSASMFRFSQVSYVHAVMIVVVVVAIVGEMYKCLKLCSFVVLVVVVVVVLVVEAPELFWYKTPLLHMLRSLVMRDAHSSTFYQRHAGTFRKTKTMHCSRCNVKNRDTRLVKCSVCNPVQWLLELLGAGRKLHMRTYPRGG